MAVFLRAQAASILACDFLTVETIFLIEYVAWSSNPDGRWVTQQARNLAMQFDDEQPFRFLIHDSTNTRPPEFANPTATSSSIDLSSA